MSEDFNMVAPKKVLIMTRVPLIIQLPWNQTQKLGSKPNFCKNPQKNSVLLQKNEDEIILWWGENGVKWGRKWKKR